MKQCQSTHKPDICDANVPAYPVLNQQYLARNVFLLSPPNWVLVRTLTQPLYVSSVQLGYQYRSWWLRSQECSKWSCIGLQQLTDDGADSRVALLCYRRECVCEVRRSQYVHKNKETIILWSRGWILGREGCVLLQAMLKVDESTIGILDD